MRCFDDDLPEYSRCGRGDVGRCRGGLGGGEVVGAGAGEGGGADVFGAGKVVWGWGAGVWVWW